MLDDCSYSLVLIDWFVNLECYFDCYKMFERRRFQFIRRKLIAQDNIYWTLLEIARDERCKNSIELWEETKDKLMEEYLLACYRNHLIDKLERRSTLNIRTQCSKCEEYEHYIYRCTSIKCSRCN